MKCLVACTFVTEIIHHDNLMEKVSWTHVDDTVNCPHQG